jgi:hypothetical protein
MKARYRILILLELILCFGPATFLLGFSVQLIPNAIPRALDLDLMSILILLSIVCGTLGLIALISVVLFIFNPGIRYINSAVIKVFILCGLTSVYTSFLILGYFREFGLLYLLPIFATIHLTYLGRYYVFNYSVKKNNIEPENIKLSSEEVAINISLYKEIQMKNKISKKWWQLWI